MTGHACLQSTSYFFPALTLLTFWVTFCVTFHLTNTLMKIVLFILLLQKHSRQLSNIVKITDFYMNLLQMMKLL